jgi:hypothetical protein
MKKQSVSSLKKKCWDLFSQIVRYRDCGPGSVYGICCTCGKTYHFSQLQAGHFIPGRHNSVLFDLRNCHAQCMKCNVFLHGNPVEYYQFMLNKYGQDVIDELRSLDKIKTQFKVWQLEIMYNEFKKVKQSL